MPELQRLEDAINKHHTDEERKKSALDIIAYMRSKGFVINNSDSDWWEAGYKDVHLCPINLEISENGVSVDFFIKELPKAWEATDGNVDFSTDEQTREILWRHLRFCERPDCNCENPPVNKIFFGKECNNLCTSFLGIYAPDAETVVLMKKLVDDFTDEVDGLCR